MRHRKRVKKLERTASHRRALLRNLVTELFRHERITTTLPKAKAMRRFAERMITFAKIGTLHARRQVLRFIQDKKVVRKLFDTLAARYSERNGGYTRVIKLSKLRVGDAAPMAVIELVDAEIAAKPSKKEERKRT
jgi:large subunit ribosomal protein L17